MRANTLSTARQVVRAQNARCGASPATGTGEDRLSAVVVLLRSVWPLAVWSARRAGGECGDDVGGVAVQRLAATVIPHRGTWVGVTGGFLHVAQRHTGVEGGGDEGVAQRVRPDWFADPGPASDPAHDPPGGVPIEPFAVGAEEDRTVHTFADCQVDSTGDAWRERHRHQLAALAQHRQRAMPTLETERLDVGTDRFGNAQPVQGEQ
jgi:hypothetical protein